jgi:hypothetical protein
MCLLDKLFDKLELLNYDVKNHMMKFSYLCLCNLTNWIIPTAFCLEVYHVLCTCFNRTSFACILCDSNGWQLKQIINA